MSLHGTGDHDVTHDDDHGAAERLPAVVAREEHAMSLEVLRQLMLAVSQDETSSSESQTAQLEGPAVEHAGSWKQRRDRLLRRLEQAGSGTPLAAHSAWAVVHGIQRARAMADEVTCECFLDSEVGGGEDALMASGRHAVGRGGRDLWHAPVRGSR